MSDPRQAAAETAGPRPSRQARLLGWLLSVLLWAVASDTRVVLALVAVVVAAALLGACVITTGWGKGRSAFWSPWLFTTAALCEVVWLVGSHVR